MKKVRIIVLASLAVILMVATSYAIPIADSNDDFGTATFLSHGYGTTNGGEFMVQVNGGGGDSTGAPEPNTYVTFCVEHNEYIWYNRAFDIASVEDYAVNGGVGIDDAGIGSESGTSYQILDSNNKVIDGKDYLNSATKWLFWSYLHNISALGFTSRNNTVADFVQKTIWYLEDEIDSLDTDTNAFYNQVVAGRTDYSFDGEVKIMNLVTYDSAGNEIARQSQLVGDPIPEPGTLMLLGLGLLGLVAGGRKRLFKKS